MDEQKKFYLKWPWNWVVCGVFVVGAGYFIGYLWSALLAALFLWLQKKRHPGEVPQGGYCLDRTRKRLARLVWSALYLFLAAGCGVVFFMGLGEDKSAWGLKDWAIEIVSGGGFAIFVLCCLYETYTDLRDAFFPAKSRLARSIRSQLPYPDEAPPVEELFAMVDRDIQENGQWFGRVAIGEEWVFGDDVSAISRIRGTTTMAAGSPPGSLSCTSWTTGDRFSPPACASPATCRLLWTACASGSPGPASPITAIWAAWPARSDSPGRAVFFCP